MILPIHLKTGFLGHCRKQKTLSLLSMLVLSTVVTANITDTLPALNTQIPKSRQVRSVGTVDFFVTAIGTHTENSINSIDRNNGYFYYCFTFHNKIQAGHLTIRNYFFNEFGIRGYADSLTVIAEDQYNLKNTIGIPTGMKNMAFQITVSNRSQFWKHYDYREDSIGLQERYLYSAYLSPGYTSWSGGLSFYLPEYSSIEIGLAGIRTVKVRNQQLFDERQANSLYGLSRGERKKSTGGLHLIVSIAPKQLVKGFYVEHQSLLFIDKNKTGYLKEYTLDLNNAFHYFILKYFRISFRTKIIYDSVISEKMNIINQFTIGYYLNNVF